MTGLQLAVGESTVSAYLMALARVAGFVLVSPPFNSRSVPVQARVALAVSLALPISVAMKGSAPQLDSSAMVLSGIGQVLVGVTLGFFVLVALSTIQAVGDLLDTMGGFSVAMALDPMLLVQTSVLGRLHQITAATVLFATNGHLMVIQGLARSAIQAPMASLSWGEVGRAVAQDVSGMFLSALQISAPVVAAMLVADVALGLLTRAAPALNAFSLGYPMKILFTLLLAGLVLARLPDALTGLVQHAAGQIVDVVPAPSAGPTPLGGR